MTELNVQQPVIVGNEVKAPLLECHGNGIPHSLVINLFSNTYFVVWFTFIENSTDLRIEGLTRVFIIQFIRVHYIVVRVLRLIYLFFSNSFRVVRIQACFLSSCVSLHALEHLCACL